MNILQKLFGNKNKQTQTTDIARPIIANADTEKIHNLISKLGSEWGYERDEVKNQLIAYKEKAVPPLILFLHSKLGKDFSPSFSIRRDTTVDALCQAFYILGEIGNKETLPELGIWTISGIVECHISANTAIAKIKARENNNLHLDLHNPYDQIAQLWTAYFQGGEQLYTQEMLNQFCNEAIQAMPNLQFSSTNHKARAWSMLGSLFYKSLHPEWNGSDSKFVKIVPCPEARKCYDEALQLTNESSPNQGWLRYKMRFSQDISSYSDEKNAKGFLESDNVGTRISAYEFSIKETSRTRNGDPIPYIVYAFPSEKIVFDSIKELSFIHTAADTGHLISTEILAFGYYKINDTVYHAIICGFDVPTNIWNEAHEIFKKNDGKLLNSNQPENNKPQKKKVESGNEVVFVREYQEPKAINFGGRVETHIMTYRIYRAENSEAAIQHLNNSPVEKELLYVIVETPEGNFCRDIKGIYKE